VGDELTLWVVLVAAAIDSINPCAIGVLLFLSTVLLRVSADKRALVQMGALYVLTVYLVYILSGLGLIWFQRTFIRQGWAEIMGVSVGVFVILLGLVELKDFFWYGKGISLEIAPRFKEKIQQMSGKMSLVGVISLGGFVAIVELPCTGGPYLAITAILAKSFDLRAFFYLLLYNFIFVLPLLGILIFIYYGASTRLLKKWRQANRKWMNLSTGLLMIGLGILLILHYKLGWYE
jgi:cytochrome c biogenesis protein CcdA